MLNFKNNQMKAKLIFKILFISMLCVSFTTVNAQRNKHKQAQRQKHQNVKRHAPHHRYANLPRWGYSTKVAPKKAIIIAHSGINYHYHSGIYYKKVGANYKIIKAPVGIRVRSLPEGRIRFLLKGKKYYYYYGTYYVKSDNDSEYITVDPPKGAKVDALPEGYNTVELNGEEFYEFEGTYYKAITNENGEEWYEVVEEN